MRYFKDGDQYIATEIDAEKWSSKTEITEAEYKAVIKGPPTDPFDARKILVLLAEAKDPPDMLDKLKQLIREVVNT